MISSFQQSPLRVAILLALATFSAYSSAADIELKAPPGGRVVVKDATGATVQLMVDAAGVVTVPALVGSGTTSLNVVCFDAAGALAKCVGLVGAVGPVGPAGPVGATGATGATGAVGPAGAVGTVGPAGPTGATGATGAPGLTGAVGPAGAQGLLGPMGPAGTAGAPGAIGPVGPAGAQGLMGPIGPIGPAGTPGGAGPAGPPGAAGAPGLMGLMGPAGTPGTPGAIGPAGPAGQVGAVGPAGPIGPIGPAGPAASGGASLKNGSGTLVGAIIGQVGNVFSAITSNGYLVRVRVDGVIVQENSIYWTGANCTGTPRYGSGTTAAPAPTMYAKYVLYSLTSNTTYTMTGANGNGIVTSAQPGAGVIASSEPANGGACAASTSNQFMYAIAATATTSMGLPTQGAVVPVTLPLQLP